MRSGKASWIGFSRMVPKPGHRDEVDVETGEGVDHLVGVRDAVEVAPEARALDELDRDAGGFGDVDRTALAVDEDHDDGEVALEHARAESCRCPTPAPRSASRWRK